VPRRLVSSLALRDQFSLPITPTRWTALAQELACPLPPLQRQPGKLWSFPQGWTVRDLAHYLSVQRPELGPPGPCTEADWYAAQVFVGVRACVAEAGCLDEAQVVRSARLMADLGLE
jgi:hypothetical protein